MRGSGWSGSVTQNDEDMSELVLVLLAQGKKNELNLKGPGWQTREGKQLVAEGYGKEMESLVDDMKAWILVSLEKSRFLRSSVPDRILQQRLALTLSPKDAGTQEVNCWCTLQGFKDPDVRDLVRDRKTESSTLSANGRAMILQAIASCRFVLTTGDVKAAFYWPTGRKGQRDLSTDHAKVVLGDQPRQWWRKFLIEQFGFDQQRIARRCGGDEQVQRWILYQKRTMPTTSWECEEYT